MKIALVTTSYFPFIGGVASHINDYAEFLTRKGHTVFVLTTYSKGLKKVEKMENCCVLRFFKVNIIEKGDQFLVEGKLVAGKTISYDIDSMRELFELLNPFIDIFHVYDYHPLEASIGVIPKDKLVFHAQYLSAENPGSAKIFDFEKKALKRANCKKVICVSQDLYHVINRMQIKNTIYIPNGVRTTVFKPFKSQYFRRKFHLPPSKKIIFHPHRFNSGKGVLRLIESLSQPILNNKNIIVLIPNKDALFGEISGLREYYEKQVVKKMKSLGVEQKILFIPPIVYKEMPAALNSSDIIIFPSSDECYGLSIATLEAMSCAKPIIRTKVLGTKVIEQGIDGLLVEKEPNDIASAIHLLLANPTIGKKLGLKARIKVRKKYDLEKIFKKIVNQY